mgnify:CR=1 FL=1
MVTEIPPTYIHIGLPKAGSTWLQQSSQFVNLANYRKKEDISPQQWWWYLDVLSYLPTSYSSAVV